MEITVGQTAVTAAELKALYRKWPDIKRFLKTLGCSGNDAEDLFQEALLIYSRKREQSGFELSADPFFYVRNTCKLLWYNQARKQNKQQTFALETDVEQLSDDWFEKEARLRTIETAMEKLGDQCRELLQLFYGLSWNMTDIAKKIGLRSDKVAKAQKYRCLQKAKELVLKNSAAQQANVEFLNHQS